MNESQDISWRRIFAEGAAIVAGILLAFAIDAWWDDQVEIKEEQRLLAALANEFESNINVLRAARTEYEERYLEAALILEYLESKGVEPDPSRLTELVRNLFRARTIHLESGAHDALLASGNLNLIRNDELRIRLAAWPSYVGEWSEEEVAVFAYVRDVFRPFFSESIRIRSIQPGFPPFVDGQSPREIPTGSLQVSSIVEISKSIAFDNLVHQRAQGLWHAMRDGETLLAQATEIERLLRESLEE
jgi:hypothetical protein